jgi:hypothetical protein
MNTKETLELAVKEARKALDAAEKALYDFNSSAENNVFDSLEDARDKLEDELRDMAFEDCQGAHNCGDSEYRQEFFVDGVKYVAICEVEYDRHDKTYYYIYGHKFRIEKVDISEIGD